MSTLCFRGFIVTAFLGCLTTGAEAGVYDLIMRGMHWAAQVTRRPQTTPPASERPQAQPEPESSEESTSSEETAVEVSPVTLEESVDITARGKDAAQNTPNIAVSETAARLAEPRPINLPKYSGVAQINDPIKVSFDPRFYWLKGNIYFDFVPEAVKAQVNNSLKKQWDNTPSPTLVKAMADLQRDKNFQAAIAASTKTLRVVFEVLGEDPLAVIAAHTLQRPSTHLQRSAVNHAAGTVGYDQPSFNDDLPRHRALIRHRTTLEEVVFDPAFYWSSFNVWQQYVPEDSLTVLRRSLSMPAERKYFGPLEHELTENGVPETIKAVLPRIDALMDLLFVDLELPLRDVLLVLSSNSAGNDTEQSPSATVSDKSEPSLGAHYRFNTVCKLSFAH